MVHAAVAELIGENDDALSVPAVADRAGVAATTIYRRWGDIDALRTEVALATLSEDGPVPDTGSLHRDLSVWAEFLITDIARPERIRFLRTLVGSTSEDTEPSKCLDKRESQISAILERARARGEQAPSHDEVMDRVVAPLYFRTLLGMDRTSTGDARALVDSLFHR